MASRRRNLFVALVSLLATTVAAVSLAGSIAMERAANVVAAEGGSSCGACSCGHGCGGGTCGAGAATGAAVADTGPKDAKGDGRAPGYRALGSGVADREPVVEAVRTALAKVGAKPQAVASKPDSAKPKGGSRAAGPECKGGVCPLPSRPNVGKPGGPSGTGPA